jgi:hypothetical protein
MRVRQNLRKTSIATAVPIHATSVQSPKSIAHLRSTSRNTGISNISGFLFFVNPYLVDFVLFCRINNMIQVDIPRQSRGL